MYLLLVGTFRRFGTPGLGDKKSKWGKDERHYTEDMEAIHEREQPRLGVELVVVSGCGRDHAIGHAEALSVQVCRSVSKGAVKRRGGGGEVTAHALLVKVLATLTHGCHESDTKAATPVSEEVGKRRCLIVLRWAELRVGHDRQGHKEEGEAETLECAGKSVVHVVRLRVQVTVVQKGEPRDEDRAKQQVLRLDNAALKELGANGGEESDHECTGSEDEARIDRAVAV